MQRVKKNKRKIGTDEVTFEKRYDSAGKVIGVKYLSGTPNERTYGYEYDVAEDGKIMRIAGWGTSSYRSIKRGQNNCSLG